MPAPTLYPYTELYRKLLSDPFIEPRYSSEMQVICPFHTDAAPSCRINLQTGLWRCFGCKAAGTAIDFVQKALGCSYGPAYHQVRQALARRTDTRPTVQGKTAQRVLRTAARYVLAVSLLHHEDPVVQAAVKAQDVGGLLTFAMKHGLVGMSEGPTLKTELDIVGSPVWWSLLRRAVAAPITKYVPSRVVQFYTSNLTTSLAFTIMKRRGWVHQTLTDFRIGYDQATRRYTIPVYEKGRCVNVRKYRPGADHDKFISYGRGYGSPRIFPNDWLQDERDLIWLEGEPDTILSWQLGIPAGTWTGGANTLESVARYRSFFHGRRIWVCYDCDSAGRTGSTAIAKWMRSSGAEVWVMDLNLPEKKADFTDYFIKHHHTLEDFRALQQTAIPVKG